MARPESALQNPLHASAVALGGKGLLILGPSGSGKSSLALELMGLGAVLVADDRVHLVRAGTRLIASAPDAIRGRIEARGIGILKADAVAEAEVALVVDLATQETERLPHQKQVMLMDLSLPVVHKSESRAFAAGLLQYLKAGRAE